MLVQWTGFHIDKGVLVYRMEIIPNIHIIPGVTANPYLLIDSDGLTLIDTGIPGSAYKILRYIKRAGYARRDLTRILLTHADYDHAGSLAALKKATGARVYASPSEARAMAAGRFPRSLKTDNPFLKHIFALAERFGTVPPTQVDEHVSEGQVLPVMSGLHVLDTRGHTPGHLSFFAPAAGILFAGDSLLSVKKRLIGSHGAVTWDQEKADAAVRKQLTLRARIVCSGPGSVLMDAIGRSHPWEERFAVSAA
jgi:glyoxylase-like metal-dependent hydrolase (beta-lactamase superfamily II)